MTAVGVAIGVAAALLLTRYLSSVLFEVQPGNPAIYAAAAATLMGVSLLAAWLPARTATTVDPIVALRAE